MVRRLLEILIANLRVTLDDSRLGNPAEIQRHSDMGTLTVLLQDNAGDLYIKVEEYKLDSRKEEWIEIPPIPSALVINVGDSLEVSSYSMTIFIVSLSE